MFWLPCPEIQNVSSSCTKTILGISKIDGFRKQWTKHRPWEVLSFILNVFLMLINCSKTVVPSLGTVAVFAWKVFGVRAVLCLGTCLAASWPLPCKWPLDVPLCCDNSVPPAISRCSQEEGESFLVRATSPELWSLRGGNDR